MSAPYSSLVRVQTAAQALKSARTELRLALEGARPHHTLEELGKAAGVTRQAIHSMLKEEKQNV
jgi:hypothetical protein